MVVCKYWLENRCRFGTNCKFEHTQGGSQGNLFGANNSWQGGGSGGGDQRVSFQQQNSRYKWVAPQAQGQSQQLDSGQRTAQDVVNGAREEMITWERSNIWPFSCVALEKDLPSLPDFQDISVEELRQEAYQAKASGSMQSYIQKFRSLVSDYQNKRDQLKHMTMDVKKKLITFIEDGRRNVSSSQLGSSPFGSATGMQASGGVATSLFGKPQQGTGTSFGGASGAGFPTQGSVFGGGSGGGASQGSVFGGGGPSQGSLFGKPQGSAAGGSSGILFGKPAQPGGSVFGGSSALQDNGRPSLLGPAPGSFVGPQPAPGLFSTGPQPAPGLFSSAANSAVPQASGVPNLFGNGGHSTSVSGGGGGSLLGNPPSLLGNPPGSSQTSLLGAAPTSVPSLFGKSGVGGAQQGSVFGGGTTAGTGFGTQASGGLFGKGSTVGAGVVSDDSHLYTPLADLTDAERVAFEAKEFELGKIPLRPPPKELVS